MDRESRRGGPAGDLLEGARFTPRAWRGAWAALGALALALALPATAVEPLAGWPGLAVLGLQGLAALAAVGALLRLATGAPGRGPGGLQLGALEARLVAAVLLCLLFLSLIAVVLGLLLAGAFGAAGLDQADLAAAGALPAWKTVLLWGLTLGSALILAALWARLALAGPATAARGRVVSLAVLPLSRGGGRGLALLAGLLLSGWPLLALAGWAVVDGAEAAWKDVAWALVLAFVQAPLTVGYLASAYSRLRALGGDGNGGRT